MGLEKTTEFSTETSPLLIGDSLGNGVTHHETDCDKRQLGVYTRLKQDPEFRHKYVKSCWIFWAFIIHGWMAGQLGAALPDLQLIIGTDLQTASLLITGGGIGLPIGGLLVGMLYNNVNTDALIAFVLFGCVAMSAMLPWCPTFAGMLTICIIFGIFKGGLDIGGNAAIATMWRMEGRQYMQTLHFMFSAGGILSPFVTGLFLVPKEHSVENTNTTRDVKGVTIFTNTTTDMSNDTHYVFIDVTTPLRHNPTGAIENIKVQYAYVITSALALSGVIPFIIMYFKDRNGRRRNSSPSVRTQGDTTHDDLNHEHRKVLTSVKLRRLCLVISAAVLLFYAGMELTFVNFLTTFCLEYFDWTKSTSSIITSVFWLTFALGRFSGIFLIRCITPGQLIFLFLLGMIFSISGMLIICLAKLDYLMWLFVSLIGYMSSTIWASLMSWLEENVTPITGRIASLVVMAAMVGEMINPIFIGYLMENVTLLTFLYIPLIESVICILLFTINHVIVVKHSQPYREIK